MPPPLLRAFSGGPPPPPPPPLVAFPPPPPPPSVPIADPSILNADIAAGIRLRKTATRDRSAPIVDGNVSSGSSSCFHGGEGHKVKLADAGPGMASVDGTSPGLFVGGIPKLRSRGGVVMGASRSPSYRSPPDPDPLPPTAPSALSAPETPTIPTRTTTPSSAPAPTSSTRQRPPPIPATRPISSSRRHHHHHRSAPSSLPPPSPNSTSTAPQRPPAGIRRTSAPHTVILQPKPPVAPPTHSSLPSYSAASSLMSPALVAARKATGDIHGSRTPPEPPASRPARMKRERRPPVEKGEDGNGNGRWRWRFRGEEELPEPGVWEGGRRVYKSGGTGSTVPLDLGLLG